MAVEDLRQSTMMSHLLDSLEQGKDIGHYGRLVFAMVAHYFADQDELVKLLLQGGDTDEPKARALVQQVLERDYSPPRRERILEWQAKQDFRSVLIRTIPMPATSTANCSSPIRFSSISRNTGNRRSDTPALAQGHFAFPVRFPQGEADPGVDGDGRVVIVLHIEANFPDAGL